jgi:transmembrane sensor
VFSNLVVLTKIERKKMTEIPHIQDKIKNLIETRSSQEPEDQIIEARQIVFEIDEIDSHVAFTRVSDRIRNVQPAYRVLNIAMRIAATLFIPLLLVSSWMFYKQFSQADSVKLAMQEITSPPGIRSQVVLPDGSKVWLNAESTLKFPVPFPKDFRNVNLLGEAFFEVTKNQKQPFVVHSGNVEVKVLGTRFDCKAFEDDKTIEVILEEGKVALNSNAGSGQEESFLKPGDRAVIDKATGETQIKNEEIGKYIAWHTGKLVFDNTSMAEVVSMLERWYGVDVVVQDKNILNYRFTTTFDNESIFHVIELLSLSSPIQMKYIQASIGKDNQTQTKAKILISKK